MLIYKIYVRCISLTQILQLIRYTIEKDTAKPKQTKEKDKDKKLVYLLPLPLFSSPSLCLIYA